MTGALLEVAELVVELGGRRVIDGVSLVVAAGARVALVGTPGAGTSLLALAILGLAPAAATVSGRIRFAGEDLVGLPHRRLAELRGDRLAMVLQDRHGALNPVMRVGRQIGEPLRVHRRADRRAVATRLRELCQLVGLPERVLDAYPHELAPGERQRAAVAMAIACRPALLIVDDPAPGLDGPGRVRELQLLRRLVEEDGTALLVISHDLRSVSYLADELVVMSHGRVVESGALLSVTLDPQHATTRRLVSAAQPMIWVDPGWP